MPYDSWMGVSRPPPNISQTKEDSGRIEHEEGLSGYVLKLKKQRVVSNWKRRYFCLRNGILKSYLSHYVRKFFFFFYLIQSN